MEALLASVASGDSGKTEQPETKDHKEITVVPMTAEHIPQIARIEEACFSTPWSEKALEEELSVPTAVFLTALAGDDVAGYMGMQVAGGVGYVCNVAVAPDCRRKGIASALIQAQIDYALRFRSKEEYDAFLIQCTKAGSYPFLIHRHPYLQEGDGLALFVASGFPIGSFLVTILRHDDADADPRQAKTWLSRVARTQSYEHYLRVNHITPGDPRYHPFFRDKNED